MPNLEDVYRKFGETSEAAQLLETELGNILLFIQGKKANLILEPNKKLASDILQKINKSTLGQLLKKLGKSTSSLKKLNGLLQKALKERNRLSHTFYRQHNFRRNTENGCAAMIEDLEFIHTTILDAYIAIMAIQGIDVGKENIPLPTKHVPI